MYINRYRGLFEGGLHMGTAWASPDTMENCRLANDPNTIELKSNLYYNGAWLSQVLSRMQDKMLIVDIFSSSLDIRCLLSMLKHDLGFLAAMDFCKRTQTKSLFSVWRFGSVDCTTHAHNFCLFLSLTLCCLSLLCFFLMI